jgi:hypothetical protein
VTQKWLLLFFYAVSIRNRRFSQPTFSQPNRQVVPSEAIANSSGCVLQYSQNLGHSFSLGDPSANTLDLKNKGIISLTSGFAVSFNLSRDFSITI